MQFEGKYYSMLGQLNKKRAQLCASISPFGWGEADFRAGLR